MTPQQEIAATPPHGTRLRFSMAALLTALILLIVASAFLDGVRGGGLGRVALTTLVYLLALIAIAARRRTFALALALIVPAIIAKWLDHFRHDLLPEGLFLVIGLTCMAYITVE